MRRGLHVVAAFLALPVLCAGFLAAPAHSQQNKFDQSAATLIDVVRNLKTEEQQSVNTETINRVILELLTLKSKASNADLDVTLIQSSEVLLKSTEFQTRNPPLYWTKAILDALDKMAKYFDELAATKDVTRAFTRRAQALLNNLDQVSKTDPQVRFSTTEVLNKLTQKQPSPTDAAAIAHGSLQPILQDIASVTVLLGDPKTVSNLAALRTGLLPFEIKREPRIHIHGAVYGDIDVINSLFGDNARNPSSRPRTPTSTSRWCIASAALTDCERQASCKLTTDYKDLCGFDPAPFLSIAKKALVVFYDCRANNDEGAWVARGDSRSIVKSFRRPAVSPDVRVAALYHKEQSFRCSPPRN
ncbi:hypothetical protein ACI2KT_30690 [Ensifer adhaerens]|uniref:hypothetical protein n=1 Tax=Ensifer adhaerens TaxID=106592 RepID=UPI00384EB1CB